MYELNVRLGDAGPTAVATFDDLQSVSAWIEEYAPEAVWELGEREPGVQHGRLPHPLDRDRTLFFFSRRYVNDVVGTVEAARILGCHPRHLRRLADAGRVPVHSHSGPNRERQFDRRVIVDLAESGDLVRSAKWGRDRTAAKA